MRRRFFACCACGIDDGPAVGPAPVGKDAGMQKAQREIRGPSQQYSFELIGRLMARRDSASVEITPEVLLKAYACGIFPMAESAEDPALYWIEPDQRGVIPLDGFHVPTRLARLVQSDRFTVLADRDFDAVIKGCAAPAPGRNRTWINARIGKLYRRLFDIGHCHTIEVYDGDRLAGGLYGVNLGAAFFGESMFHHVRDASKVALVHLVARLRAGGFKLLDTQFVTDHLRQFGAFEVPRRAYHKLLANALVGEGNFAALALDRPVAGATALALARARIPAGN
jgi:leucyl/phenylalanyl-tRNA--protein transferase